MVFTSVEKSTEKSSIIQQHQRGNKDTGSSEVQIALLTWRIRELTEHLKLHKKDVHSRHGLLGMVAKRKRLLNYLKTNEKDRHLQLIQTLGIRDQQ